jgi:dihydropteroate synthase
MPSETSPVDASRSPTIAWGFDAFEPGDMPYLRPAARLTGAAADAALAAGQALPTGRPGEAASLIEIVSRRPGGLERRLVSAVLLRRWIADHPAAATGLSMRLDRLTRRRASWAGLSLDRPLVMGIVNVTPDSFSDGGAFLAPDRAIEHGRALLAAGADLLDIGGESTRPGAIPVAPDIEAQRILPVIRGLAAHGAVISVDTRHPVVMRAALAAGARIINDVTALREPGALEMVGSGHVPVLLMHMQGEPATMQIAPVYEAVALDVFDVLEQRISAAMAAGLARSDIMVDPGVGFGKSLADNLAIIAGIGLYRTTGCGVAAGVSRKSFIGAVTGESVPTARGPGSLAAALAAVAAGADLIRVHDVAETIQALRVIAALHTL